MDEQTPEKGPTIANVVQLEAMVYCTFKGRFHGMEAYRDYSGTILLVPLSSGQMGKITMTTLSADEVKQLKERMGI